MNRNKLQAQLIVYKLETNIRLGAVTLGMSSISGGFTGRANITPNPNT